MAGARPPLWRPVISKRRGALIEEAWGPSQRLSFLGDSFSMRLILLAFIIPPVKERWRLCSPQEGWLLLLAAQRFDSTPGTLPKVPSARQFPRALGMIHAMNGWLVIRSGGFFSLV